MSALENAIRVAAMLRERQKYTEAIDLIDKALQDAPASDYLRADANREGLRAAEAAGLPKVSQRFSDALAIPEKETPEDEED